MIRIVQRIKILGVGTFLFFLTIQLFGQANTEGVYNVKDFGALGDGVTLETTAVQAAINKCYLEGGGQVRFSEGQYLLGTIILKENVRLFLEKDATIYASHDIEDYRIPLDEANTPILIYANGANNIGLEGRGTINGRANHVYEDLKRVDLFIKDITENARKAGVEMKRYYKVAPVTGLVLFTNCSNVTIQGITLRESTYWSLHLLKSNTITIRDIQVYSNLEKGVNADGIDINCCKDVSIIDCVVETGDDAIVLKTWYDIPCENILVTNCELKSSSTALKLGTESMGDFKNIHFKNCRIKDSNRGLAIVIRDGANVNNIRFSDISIECSRRHFNWWGNADPIWIILTKRRESSRIGSIQNVMFENIIANGMGTSKIESTVGEKIKDISFVNVSFNMKAENYKDKRASHAFVAHCVENLTLTNVFVNWDRMQVEKKWESALSIYEIDNLIIKNFRGSQGLVQGDYPIILLHNVTNGYIINAVTEFRASIFIKISGAGSNKIILNKIDIEGKTEKRILVDPALKEEESIYDLDNSE